VQIRDQEVWYHSGELGGLQLQLVLSLGLEIDGIGLGAGLHQVLAITSLYT